MSEPFFAISNGELVAAPTLGETYSCPRCGADHPIEDSVSSDGVKGGIQFVRCLGDLYMVGIGGKSVGK